MKDKERNDLTARYERVTARIRDMDTLNMMVPQELKNEQERLRRQLDALLED